MLILNWLYDIFLDIEACFTRNLGFNELVHTYWYLFFVEFPRYYLLEIIIIINFKLFYKQRRRRKEVARMMLFSENPLVSIIVPGKNEGKHIYKLTES